MRSGNRIAAIAGLALLAFLLTGAVPQSVLSSGRINWYEFDAGIDKGRQEGKKIYINFYSDLCQYCEAMERQTFVDPSVVSYLGENFIAIRVNSDRERKLAEDFRVNGLPDNWFMRETGEVIGHRPGFIPPDTFFKILQSVQKAEGD
jgi:thioredoxin-related protein